MANQMKKLIPGFIAIACLTTGCGKNGTKITNKIGEEVGKHSMLAGVVHKLSIPESERFFNFSEKAENKQLGEEKLAAAMGFGSYKVMGTQLLPGGKRSRTYLMQGEKVLGYVEGKTRPNMFIKPNGGASFGDVIEFYAHDAYDVGVVVTGENGGKIYAQTFGPRYTQPAPLKSEFVQTIDPVTSGIGEGSGNSLKDFKNIANKPFSLAGILAVDGRTESFFLSDGQQIVASVNGGRNFGTGRRPECEKEVSVSEICNFLGHGKSLVTFTMRNGSELCARSVTVPKSHKEYAKAQVFECMQEKTASQIMTEPGVTLASDAWRKDAPSVLDKMPIPSKNDHEID